MPLIRRIKEELFRSADRLLQQYPKRVECNICHWGGRRFSSDFWHPHTICPRCKSQVRHRLLLAVLDAIENSTSRSLVKGKEVLHFAPEPVLAEALSRGARHYVTADFSRRNVDLRLDICDMAAVADATFDLVVACDVLEHVENDASAITELHRILKPGGSVVVTVPQKEGLATTDENPLIRTPKARLEAYGKEDHVRIYGDDFAAILERHGFDVETHDESRFEEERVRRNVLFPPVLSAHPLATNYRKIFIGGR